MSKLLRISLYLLILLIAVICCLFLFFRRDRTATSMQAKKVFILRHNDQFTLYRNGKPFFIKGAGGNGSLAKLHETGGNTLRTWDTTNIRFLLDEAAANDIAVIVGLDLPVSSSKSFYRDNVQVSAQLNAYRAIVKKYRSHPALLMWCLGNEVDFPYAPRWRPFYKAYNNLLDMIHEEDPDHPVTTALINLDSRCIYNIKVKIPDLDLIAINTFGTLSVLQKELNALSWFWKGPFLISEWGINGPWESEATAWGAPIENTSIKKAEQYLERSRQLPVNNPRFLGACSFYWGYKQEGTHTWYSFFSPDGRASEMVNTMQYLWTGKKASHRSPDIKYMLVEGKGARDNILLKADSIYSAELLVNGPPGPDSITLVWELVAEDWFRKNPRDANLTRPINFDSLLLSPSNRKVNFRTPSTEGPYRIFVTVYDQKGYYSTANTPFYVVEK
jgi:hypothetical protein